MQTNQYDAEGLRFEMKENERLLRLAYHKGELLYERSGEEETSYHLGLGIEARQDGQGIHYYHQDEQLSTALLTSKTGEIQNHYQYDAFGRGLEQSEQVSNRIRYTGQQYDSLAEQYYLRARYYNPILGRFMQEDVYQGDGLNLYAYCDNNPVTYYDPSGYAGTPVGDGCPPGAQHGADGGEGDIPDANKSIKNWKGEDVKVPEGHIMSQIDPEMSQKPIVDFGPYTDAQRDQFMVGNSAETHLAPHHRNQIPVRDGGVIDEIPGPGHPAGNQHTKGSPTRHPSPSIFNREAGGNNLRQQEILTHWKEKGTRLVKVGDNKWVDNGY